MKALKKIPYGISSYKTIKHENYYYVDKTAYIPLLEEMGKFLFLIRPRRFGKSSLLTLLECYYDIARQAESNDLFQGTQIANHPTPEKNTYLILKFNFSQVSPNPENVATSFQEHANTSFFFFREKYREFLDERGLSMMEKIESPHGKLEFLLRLVASKGLKVYILIDEYDNFANTILTTAGRDAYHELTHGSGFLRFFFNVLKGSVDQADSGVSRMFITGVSPITMDDVTSGFNIGQNISLLPEFNTLLGFTETDMLELLRYYHLPSTPWDEIFCLLTEWCGQYRFSAKADATLYNPDMAFYYIKHFIKTLKPPDYMIDQNVKVDYGKLRHLMVLDQRLNGNFSYLNEITQSGGTTAVQIAESFPLERLMKPSNFISLLFYFGLLSYTKSGDLQTPNRTVKLLLYGYIRDGYEDVNVFNVDFWRFANLIQKMAYNGQWLPVFEFLANEVHKQTSVRDYLTGEKVIQTFLLAYLNITDYYITRTEDEMGKGFADIYMEPFTAKYPEVRYGYLIELKYIARNDDSENKQRMALADAKKQLEQYAGDQRVAQLRKKTALKCLALIFCGWELKTAVECAIKDKLEERY